MIYKILLLFILILLLSLIITLIVFHFRTKTFETNSNKLRSKINLITNENENLNDQIEYLHKVKNADENIFSFLRCQNIPMKPVCKYVDEEGNSVCRTRFVDCNKFKAILMDDPIAIERSRLATDVLTDHRYGRSETLFPIRDWFYGTF